VVALHDNEIAGHLRLISAGVRAVMREVIRVILLCHYSVIYPYVHQPDRVSVFAAQEKAVLERNVG